MKVANNIISKQTNDVENWTRWSKNLTKSTDNRLLAVIEEKGHHIKM